MPWFKIWFHFMFIVLSGSWSFQRSFFEAHKHSYTWIESTILCSMIWCHSLYSALYNCQSFLSKSLLKKSNAYLMRYIHKILDMVAWLYQFIVLCICMIWKSNLCYMRTCMVRCIHLLMDFFNEHRFKFLIHFFILRNRFRYTYTN